MLVSYFLTVSKSHCNLTFSGWPATATSVPLLVYSRCEADSVTDSIEYGDPSTSNRASAPVMSAITPNEATAGFGTYQQHPVSSQWQS